MENQRLSSLLCFYFFIVLFSSCINQDYDLTNEQIDTNVLFGDGFNMRIGNVERILFYKNIGYGNIQTNPDGSLYIEYQGDLDPKQFKIPDYAIDDIKSVSTDRIPLQFPSEVSNTFDFSSLLSVPLWAAEKKIEYKVTKPQFDNTEENRWTMVPDIIVFDSFTIYAKFILQGFSNLSGSANINLHMTFPEGFEVEGMDANRTITRSIDFNNNNPDGEYVIPEGIKVKSYTYKDISDIRLHLDFGSINGFKGDMNDPIFKLTLETEQRKVIQCIKGKVTGRVSIFDKINGFETLKKSFGENAVLQFSNPSLTLSINTNLGANFRLDIDKIDAHNGQYVTLAGNDGLQFERPNDATGKTTAFYIAPDPNLNISPGSIEKKPLSLNQLFSSIPEDIYFNLSMNVDESDVTLHNNVLLEGNYKLTLPLIFDNFNADVKIAPIYLKDMYDRFFQHVKNKLTIQADSVFISAEKFDQFKLFATIKFLDAEQQELLTAKTEELGKGLNTGKFVFDFAKEDVAKLEKAQYIHIALIQQGKGELTKDDYIDIKGLRIISDEGILYEIN